MRQTLIGFFSLETRWLPAEQKNRKRKCLHSLSSSTNWDFIDSLLPQTNLSTNIMFRTWSKHSLPLLYFNNISSYQATASFFRKYTTSSISESQHTHYSFAKYATSPTHATCKKIKAQWHNVKTVTAILQQQHIFYLLPSSFSIISCVHMQHGATTPPGHFYMLSL